MTYGQRRSKESVGKAFDAAADHFGALHGAVCTAGIVAHSHTTPFVDITAEEFDNTCAVNLRGSRDFFLCLPYR